MRRLWALALALVLLTGCAALEEEEPEVDWETYQQELPAESEAQEPEAPELPAAFSLAYHKGSTLDPITCGEGVQQDIAALIYEPLFRLNEQFEPVPVLCEGWEWNDTGLVCTITLRDGVTFQDGSRLTAKDAAAALTRAAASERYGYRLRGMASAAANRAGKLVITLTAPNRGFLALLDIPIVKNGTQERTVPMGTGPYKFISDDGGVRLEADPDWWQQKPLPVSTIPLVHAKDRDTAMYLFSTRQVELMTVDPTDDLSAVTGQSENTDRPTTILQFVGFNTREGRVFADAAARAAFSQGIPRQIMADARMTGLAVPAQFPVPPVSALYPKDLERAYSPEETLAALRAAGQETGETKELTFLVSAEDSFHRTSAKFIAENLSKLDWHITVNALPWEEYLLALEAGEFDLYFGEVRLTADWDLTDLIGTEGLLNYGGYTDPAMDALLLAFAGGDQAASFRVLASQFLSAAPIAPVCFKSYTVLTHPGVAEGLSPTASSTFSGLEGWTVHLAEPTE